VGSWQLVGSSSPELSKFISEEEKEFITKNRGSNVNVEQIPWKKIFTSMPVYAVVINHFCVNWSFYLLLTWLPSYIKNVLKFDVSKSTYVSFLPYLLLFLVAIFAGRAADFALQKGYNKTTVRKVFQLCGLLTSSIFLILLCLKLSVLEAVIFMT